MNHQTGCGFAKSSVPAILQASSQVHNLARKLPFLPDWRGVSQAPILTKNGEKLK